jgi:hypothetical protein
MQFRQGQRTALVIKFLFDSPLTSTGNKLGPIVRLELINIKYDAGLALETIEYKSS